MAEGFLGRWSQRKADAREGKPLAEPVAPPAPPEPQEMASPVPQALPAQVPETPAAPLPTLEDARSLTPESDFRPFMARGVDPQVKNAAMKQLFADPHFNVMDRMDIYIDDYSLSDPIPESMMRQMASAQFLKLFDEKEPAAAGDDADASSPQGVAQSAISDRSPDAASPDTLPEPVPQHAHADLRLQPNDAPGCESPGEGAP
jgi:Protein of unknown function (DUF3306)